VWAAQRAGDGTLRLRVSDTGLGHPRSTARIFERFLSRGPGRSRSEGAQASPVWPSSKHFSSRHMWPGGGESRARPRHHQSFCIPGLSPRYTALTQLVTTVTGQRHRKARANRACHRHLHAAAVNGSRRWSSGSRIVPPGIRHSRWSSPRGYPGHAPVDAVELPFRRRPSPLSRFDCRFHSSAAFARFLIRFGPGRVLSPDGRDPLGLTGRAHAVRRRPSPGHGRITRTSPIRHVTTARGDFPPPPRGVVPLRLGNGCAGFTSARRADADARRGSRERAGGAAHRDDPIVWGRGGRYAAFPPRTASAGWASAGSRAPDDTAVVTARRPAGLRRTSTCLAEAWIAPASESASARRS